MKLLTDQFEEFEAAEDWRRWLLPNLRADLRGRSVWYCGRTSRLLSLRMLCADGGLCTLLYRLMQALRRWGRSNGSASTAKTAGQTLQEIRSAEEGVMIGVETVPIASNPTATHYY